MNRNPEIPRPLEHGASRPAKDGDQRATITTAQVEQIVAQRLTMFGKIERYITVRLRQQLKEKMELERAALLAIVNRRAGADRAAKKSTHILSRAFFEFRPLDISLFE